MDSTEFTLTLELRQDHHQTVPLTTEDRRSLLGASLRLLGNRFACGKAILKDDVTRVALLADDVVCAVRS